jgi:hydrogenase maturation factor
VSGFCQDDHCVTCGDIAEPMKVVRIDEGRELALCSAPDGERHTVEIAFVLPVEAGDELLVHAGTAIARAEEEVSAEVRR